MLVLFAEELCQKGHQRTPSGESTQLTKQNKLIYNGTFYLMLVALALSFECSRTFENKKKLLANNFVLSFTSPSRGGGQTPVFEGGTLSPEKRFLNDFKMSFSNLSNIFLWIINNLFVTYDVFQKWFETGCFEIVLKTLENAV